MEGHSGHSSRPVRFRLKGHAGGRSVARLDPPPFIPDIAGMIATPFNSPSGRVHRTQPSRRTTANQAFGPTSENLASVNSGFTSIRVGWKP